MRDRKLALNTLIVMVAFAADKGLAVIRDLVIGRRFGAGYEYDAFSAAIQTPELLFTIIAGGALVAAFIPVLAESITGSDPEESWRLASSVLNIVVLILLFFGLVVGIFAEPITARWLVPEFEPEKQALTAHLLRIVLIQTFLFGVSGVVIGVLHAHKHFFLPAVAPLFYNLGQIFGAVVLSPRMGISGLAWGMTLGALVYLLLLGPGLWWFQARYFLTLGLRLPGVQKIGRLMAPRLVSLGLVELADVIFVRLGSRLPDGHISAYFWGWRLMQLPETLFGTALAQVFFPTLAELASTEQWDELRQKVNAALRIVLTLTLPSAAGLILLGRPLISLIGGAFDEQAVELVYGALAIFSIRLIGEALLEIAARLFYAQQDTVTPMLAAALGQTASIGLAIALVGEWGYRGLVVATTIGFWLESGLLLLLAQRRLGGVLDGRTGLSVVRAALGTAALSVLVALADRVVPSAGGRLATVLHLLVAGGAGLAAYVGVLAALKSPELRAIPALLSRSTAGR